MCWSSAACTRRALRRWLVHCRVRRAPAEDAREHRQGPREVHDTHEHVCAPACNQGCALQAQHHHRDVGRHHARYGTVAVECFEQRDSVDITMADGVPFKDSKTVEMFLEPLRRGLNDKNAVMAYQVRVYQLPVESGPSQGTASGCCQLCPPPSFTDRL